MEILITSKTHKGNAACVGGLIINNNRFVRLLSPGAWDQYADTAFNVGDIWDISFTDVDELEPPHIEDIIIHTKRYIRRVENFTGFIKNSGVTIFHGSPNGIFNGLLGWTGSGSGYIESNSDFPDNSVGFWISDKDLEHSDKHFVYPAPSIYAGAKRLKYVGFENPVEVIPAGTMLRVSLARWWKPEDSDFGERCYLQLSGWYDLV